MPGLGLYHVRVSPVISTRPATMVRRIAAALAAVLISLTVLVGPGAPVAHAQDSPTVSVHLEQLDPSSIAGQGTLTLAGSLTNSTDSPISGVTVVLWRDKRPITNVDALRLTLDGTSESDEMPVTSDGGTAAIGLLGAHATMHFSVRADFASGSDPLQLSSPDTVSIVGVSVLDAAKATIGSSRVLMANPAPSGYRAATVVELSSAPSLLGDQSGRPVFSDDHLAREIAPGGRLDLLAGLAEQSGVNAVIDPLLWDELSGMAGGYGVQQADGSVSSGDAAGAAAAFLARLGEIAKDGRCYRGLYGMLDLQAASSAGRSELLSAALSAVPSTHPLATLPLVVLPAQGALSTDLLSFLAPAAPQLVLTADLDANTAVATSASGETLVAVRSAIASGGPGPAPSDDLVHRIGRLQSEQLLSSSQGTPALSVVSTAEQARAELAPAPGRQRVPLSELVTGHRAPGLTISHPEAASPPDALASAERTARDTEALVASLSGVPSWLDMDAVSLRAWSSSFPAVEQATAYLAAASHDANAKIGGGTVTVHISPQLVVPTEETQLPISLTNTMKMTTHVRVHFVSDNPQRVRIDDTDEITLNAGDSATVRIAPQASANGTVAMHAVVTAANGTPLPSSEPVSFIVTATNAGRAAWVIIIASGAILLGLTALRVRQVRHERARADHPRGGFPENPSGD
ncbi:hypothetical protein SAMN05443377_10894 [Propionibacterium cyclohexanicum]|uniref:Glycoprotein n=1 Tax=Propionibacterium cyclohexanicum TaxID=64702 RepID=A0A1H9RPZ2_9ACTN|nr:hypothetical protein SAMN05443377_10894 [Propionibacterium cyclohexanicum]